MTRPDWIERLRADPRAVDPDPVLLAQLVELSSRSVAPAPRPGRSAGARLAMVLGGVIAVGATSWAAGALPGTTSPFHPEERITHQPTDPTPDERAPGETPSDGPTPPEDGTPPAPPPSSGPERSESPEPPAGPPTSPGRGSSSGAPFVPPAVPQLPVTPDLEPDVRPGVDPEVPADRDPPQLQRTPDLPPPAAPPHKDDADDDDRDSDSDPGRSPQPRDAGGPGPVTSDDGPRGTA